MLYWRDTPGDVLAVLGGPYVKLGIKSRSAACKAWALSDVIYISSPNLQLILDKIKMECY